ncbi:MAG TPA: Plug domain-containing protein, partial [Longimicrobium sp.]|nr:Plug domain-containing protein [Longimicrobium sp.]
ELAAADPLEVEFRIPLRAITLDSLTVTAEQQRMNLATTGFYTRREREQGVFMDREQIEKRRAVRTMDLLRAIPGVRLVATGGYSGTGPTQQLQMRGFGGGQGPCVPRIFIDGMQIAGADTDLDDIVFPHHIEAVEVYRGSAQVPVAYGGASGACGVILIWTRRS